MLTLEGEEFPITGGVQGADGPGNSFVYVPSLKAVITGDIVFDRVYFGVPRDAARQNWLKTIEQIAALKPAIVIPGHEGPGATRDMRSIEFMKKYIADWDANVARSKTAAEMRANVLQQYPGLGMEFTLNDRVATYFPAQPAGGKVMALHRRRRGVPLVALLVALAGTASVAAQPAGSRKGSLERITVHGRALEGNLEAR